MPPDCPKRKSRPFGGFSLIELLVAVAVLAMLLVLLVSMSDQIMRVWRHVGGQAQTWQEARSALELISRRMAQATLNPHWTYDDPVRPTRYLRHSDLHFLIEPAGERVGDDAGPGSAVFFQAMLGATTNSSNRSLTGMLNTCGFYVERGTVDAPVVNAAAGSDRYRLMEARSPAEKMTAYGSGGQWVTDAVESARPIAENIILLVVRPMESTADGTMQPIGTQIAYDSTLGATSQPQLATANQLPPVVEITLVAVEDSSAERLSSLTLPTVGRFLTNAQFEEHLSRLEEFLVANHIGYRVLRNRIALPNSKWNG